MTDAFTLHRGTLPLLVSMPHVGTALPDALRARLLPEARTLPDTDWHVDRLYDFAAALGASTLRAVQSRTVIDLNRPPDDASLYPGQATTGLCPTTLFDGTPLYTPGDEPGAGEIAERRRTVWQPYHDALAGEIARLKAAHGYALLYDAHSIRSEVPRLFPGRLPDLNLGSNGGASADPRLVRRLAAICAEAEGFTSVVDGRFRGGYITRHYGRPGDGVHAVQMELAQRRYMDEDPPYAWRDDSAAELRPVLRRLLEAMVAWRPA